MGVINRTATQLPPHSLSSSMRCSIVIRTEGQQQDNHAGDRGAHPAHVRTQAIEQTGRKHTRYAVAVGTGTSFSTSGDLTGPACCCWCTVVPHASVRGTRARAERETCSCTYGGTGYVVRTRR